MKCESSLRKAASLKNRTSSNEKWNMPGSTWLWESYRLWLEHFWTTFLRISIHTTQGVIRSVLDNVKEQKLLDQLRRDAIVKPVDVHTRNVLTTDGAAGCLSNFSPWSSIMALVTTSVSRKTDSTLKHRKYTVVPPSFQRSIWVQKRRMKTIKIHHQATQKPRMTRIPV